MKKLYVEIADNPIRREYGLMDRKKIGENEGMLFKFPQSKNLSFWMRNTYIPLDIAFIDDHGKIIQIESMNPLSTKMTKSKNPCKYALEVNSKWFEKNKIGVGSKIINLSECQNNKRFAQAVTEAPVTETPNIGEQTGQPPNVQDPSLEQQPVEQQPNVNEDVQLNMSIRSKLDYATNYNLPILIVYRTLDGNTLPPRKLMPIPGEGYPVESGKSGYHFKGLDISPNINGGGMEITGGHPKSFILDNVIGLEIINEGNKNLK